MKTSREVIRARREREKKHRIKTILNSAEKVFSENGFFNATMDEIALGAEVSKPTIYQYFKTKEVLFGAFAIPIIEAMNKGLQEAEDKLDNDQIPTLQHLIQEVFDGLFNVYKKSPEMFMTLQVFQATKLLFNLHNEVSEKIISIGKKNFISIRRILHKAIEKGLLEECDTYALADIIWGATIGIIQVEDIKNDHKQNHKFKKTAFEMSARLLGNNLGKQPADLPLK